MKLPEPRQPGAGRSDLDSVGGNRGVSQNKKKGGRAGGAPPPTRKNSGIKTPNEPRKIYVTILPLCGGMSPLTLTLKLLRGGELLLPVARVPKHVTFATTNQQTIS